MIRRGPLAIDGPLLVVSPHFDDVALSCETLISRPEPMTVLHVCTQRPEPPVSTEWDRRSGFADSDESARVRRAEEATAFAGTPHTFAEVGLLDGQYVPAGPRSATDLQRITDAVQGWIDAVGGPCTVALPVGAGRVDGALVPLARLRSLVTKAYLSSMHPDHLASRDGALVAVRARPEVTVVLYEELPYRCTTRGDRSARAVVSGFGARARAEVIDVAVDRRRKAERLQAYATQLPLLLPERARSIEGLARFLPAHERYWRVRRA